MLVCPWCQESIRYSFRNSPKLALRRLAFGTDGIENEKDQKSKILILQLVAKVFDGRTTPLNEILKFWSTWQALLHRALQHPRLKSEDSAFTSIASVKCKRLPRCVTGALKVRKAS